MSTRINRGDVSARLAAGLLLIIIPLVHAQNAPKDPRDDTIRFDAVLELNAPLLRTNALIFARYWVSLDHYSISLVWAEPFRTGLNFPVEPMTLRIASSPGCFSIASQLQLTQNATFSKHSEQRGVFRHKFNSYPLADLRFAESEALASRIYRRDLKDMLQDTNGTFRTVDIKDSPEPPEHGVKRSVAQASIRLDHGCVTEMHVVDANDQQIKKLIYEYSTDGREPLLIKQNVLLPERLTTIGYMGKGVTITTKTGKHTFKEFPAFYHEGGRDCTVQYRPFKLDDELLSLPSRVVVRKGNDNAVLRIAHMSNFVHLRMTEQEAKQAASEFARFDPEELTVRELLDRYWLKNADEIAEDHAVTLRDLRTHFEATSARGSDPAKQLKRLHMLMQLDWMQGDLALERHFREYLATMTANGFCETLIAGGCEIIDMTARWRQFGTANRLTDHWVDTVATMCSPSVVLHYVESQLPGTRCWTTARLLERSLKSQDWGQAKLAGQVLHCVTLQKTRAALLNPESSESRLTKAQGAWVAASCGLEGVTQALHESLAEAKQTFAGIEEPTAEQRKLQNQLDAIEKTLDAALSDETSQPQGTGD